MGRFASLCREYSSFSFPLHLHPLLCRESSIIVTHVGSSVGAEYRVLELETKSLDYRIAELETISSECRIAELETMMIYKTQ